MSKGVRQIDHRSIRILQEIIANPQIRMTDLEHRLQLSRKQVQYGIHKINNWLQEHRFPLLQYHRSTGFEVTPEMRDALFSIQKMYRPDQYVLNEEERARVILLLLLSKTEDYSLIHFTSQLDVSRNTVLQDLKKAKDIAADFSCSIRYSRREGYLLVGKEWSIRSLLNHLISIMIMDEQKIAFLYLPLSADVQKKVANIQQEMEQIEQVLKIRYIDERLHALPFLIAYIWIRIQCGNRIEKIEEDGMKVILSSKEHRALSRLFDYLDLRSPKYTDERAYLTLLLLTTNLSEGDHLFNQQDQYLLQLTKQVIEQFETIACVNLLDREALARQLFQHLKPAYYRAKFNIQTNNPLYQTIIQEQPELHHLVTKALQPFHAYLGQSLSNNEAAYITMHFGSWLKKQGTELSNRLKAVVVCPKGIAISKLLIHQLKEMFPEILFWDALSLREFYSFPFSYEMVFSTVFVRTKARLFIVKPLIDQEERQRLYQAVMQELYGFSPSSNKIDQLITEMDPYITIHDKEGLKKTLSRVLTRQPIKNRVGKELDKPVLADLITKDTIQFAKEITDWEEAIQLASKPLLERQTIEPSYVEAMIESIKKDGPYVVMTPKVAIPHARPEKGVNVLSMSLLILEKGVLFPEEKLVHLMFILAAIDNETHLKALAQLTELLSKKENIDHLILMRQKSEVLQLIHKYSQGDDSK